MKLFSIASLLVILAIPRASFACPGEAPSSAIEVLSEARFDADLGHFTQAMTRITSAFRGLSTCPPPATQWESVRLSPTQVRALTQMALIVIRSDGAVSPPGVGFRTRDSRLESLGWARRTFNFLLGQTRGETHDRVRAYVLEARSLLGIRVRGDLERLYANKTLRDPASLKLLADLRRADGDMQAAAQLVVEATELERAQAGERPLITARKAVSRALEGARPSPGREL